jgi:chloride channel protein, CIC family
VFVSDRVQPGSIYTLPLLRRGIVYAEPEDIDIMQTVRVGEVMTANPDTVPADMPLPALIDEFGRTRHHGFPVVEDGRLVGVVTLSDLGRAGPDGLEGAELTAGDICTRHPLTVTPDDPVFRAVRRMASLDVGRLPVVSPDDHGRLVGLVRRADIVKAYQRAVTRSLGVQHRQQSSRLRDLSGARFVEFVVEPAAPVTGEAVRDVPWPERTVLTSVRRGADLIMPNGDTVLQAGDVVVALTQHDTAAEVRRLLVGED